MKFSSCILSSILKKERFHGLTNLTKSVLKLNFVNKVNVENGTFDTLTSLKWLDINYLEEHWKTQKYLA